MRILRAPVIISYVIQTDTTGIQRDKNETLGILLAFYFLKGIGDGLIGVKAGIYPLFWLAAMICGVVFMMRWFVLDARQHKYTISKAMTIMLVAFALFTAPFYFLNTRGKGAWRTILWSFLFLLGCGFFAACGEALALVLTGQSLDVMQTL